MAFGLGKNRSSRPLSMILPDNVKLFNKKKGSFMERASQEQQSRRAVEDRPSSTERRKSRQSVLVDSRRESYHSHSSQSIQSSRSSQSSQDSGPKKALVQRQSPEPQPGAVTGDIKNSHSSVVEESAPFLTLQLDDNRHSLLGLSRELSEFNASKESLHRIPNSDIDVYSQQPASAATVVADESHMSLPSVSTLSLTPAHSDHSGQSTAHSTPVPPASERSYHSGELRSDSASIRNEPASRRNNTPIGSDIGSRFETLSINASPSPALSQDSVDAACEPLSPTTDSANISNDTIELTDMPWAVKTRDTPVLFQLDHHFEAPELDESSHSQPDSTDSMPSSYRTIDERIVSANRKVVFNHGVYIFDPAQGAELAALKLTEDDLFNPFEL